MNDTPWYMRTVEPGVENGSPESERRVLESLASTASESVDAEVAHLKNAEAKGVDINPSMRMAMGYAAVARKAADRLDDAAPTSPSISAEGTTPEQRIASGYYRTAN
ncbi:hypothetical protein OG746_20875 [Streptomyces sp. NBC_01016]|uniref:hypothetical protein n=1 Tax=Streptomyces sp. NBC_01016 TaxID=2903720 RepID=UPI0022526DDC|nr:hypothetical protein [Streptomyces sp. NBC_01016]MCX4831193.1 hypothetical protein [Streptomyces sp. NBC_01016]